MIHYDKDILDREKVSAEAEILRFDRVSAYIHSANISI